MRRVKFHYVRSPDDPSCTEIHSEILYTPPGSLILRVASPHTEQVSSIFLVSRTDLLANNFHARQNGERKGIHWTDSRFVSAQPAGS